MEVVTNVSLVFSSFLNALTQSELAPKLIFDPTLDYEESVSGLRAYRTMMDQTLMKTFPLFAWNRSPIVPEEDIGKRRMRVMGDRNTNSGTRPVYKSFLGQTEFRFAFITNDIMELEAFEILYSASTDIAGIKTISVSFPAIGDLNYFITWEDLTEITFNKEDNLYMLVGSSAIIKGEFLVFDQDYGYIETIKVSVRRFNNWILEDFKIDPFLREWIRAHSRVSYIDLDV